MTDDRPLADRLVLHADEPIGIGWLSCPSRPLLIATVTVLLPQLAAFAATGFGTTFAKVQYATLAVYVAALIFAATILPRLGQAGRYQLLVGSVVTLFALTICQLLLSIVGSFLSTFYSPDSWGGLLLTVSYSLTNLLSLAVPLWFALSIRQARRHAITDDSERN